MKEDIFLSILFLTVKLSDGVTQGDIRLVGGLKPYEGRVEIYYYGKWGTVCDDDWDLIDAHVVCRQLKFNFAIEAFQSANFGQGEGEIWINNVRCDGSERRLSDCPLTRCGGVSCSHSKDAGVRCTGVTQDFIRLVGGLTPYEGRVEIYYNRKWGTVCDDSWDLIDAHVVCRQLRLNFAIEAFQSAKFGQGEGEIWIDDVNCNGTERRLTDCTLTGWGGVSCSHSEDAGVRCVGPEPPPPPPQNDESHEYALDHNTSLSYQLGELFDSGRDCDLTIVVMVDSIIVKSIYTHKLVLSLDPAISFKNVVANANSLSIDVSSNCHQHVTTVVRFLYTRQINISLSSAECIHKIASDWGLKQLQDEAGKLFSWFLPEDPTFQSQNSLYEYSTRTGDESLQEICLRYLAWNFEALIRSPAWTSLPLGTVKVLLSRSDLVVPSELYVLKGLERWEAAYENKSISKSLLELIRFPMIPAEDLYRLNDSRYHTNKLQGFQFNALHFGMLLGELAGNENAYTPRIYTGSPWSFNVPAQAISGYKNLGLYTLNRQSHNTLTSTFQTPVHYSAFYVFTDILWETGVYINDEQCSNNSVTCPSLPIVSLAIQDRKGGLPKELEKRIIYKNRLVVMCEEKYVYHIQEFDGQNLALVPTNNEGQVYPCLSNQFSYQVVVRPQYTTA